jgi:putative transposase
MPSAPLPIAGRSKRTQPAHDIFDPHIPHLRVLSVLCQHFVAKQLIHEMYLAPTRKAALAAYDQFISSYQIKFPKACECLQKDKEVLFTFYDFPAQHWPHLRTTNPIESTFATVRLRTHRTKGSGSRIATLTMVFKLGMEAQKQWRRLNGPELVAKVVTGVKFVDGEEQIEQAA